MTMFDEQSGRVQQGSLISPRQLVAISGSTVVVPDPSALVHLQFRRFAGCPVCNLHLRSMVRRHDEVRSAGVREVIVFHSTGEELRVHAADLPFAVIADPDKQLYVEFGVEASRRALLDPRAWPTILVAVAVSLWGVLRRGASAPSLNPHGGRYGLPADVLIDTDGRVVAAKYGAHADDQWSVDEVLAHAHDAEAKPITSRSST